MAAMSVDEPPTARFLRHSFRACATLAASLLLVATTGTARGEGAAPAIDESRVVDLTYTFDDTTIYWPTEDGFHLEVGKNGLNSKPRNKCGEIYGMRSDIRDAAALARQAGIGEDRNS